jgi:hypothetical protein
MIVDVGLSMTLGLKLSLNWNMVLSGNFTEKVQDVGGAGFLVATAG